MTNFDHLTPEKRRELLAAGLRKRAAQPVIEFLASQGQTAMFLLQDRDPGGSAYNVLLSGDIRADVDADRLRITMGRLAERHSVLRTTYESRDGNIVQVVHPRLDPEVDEFKCGTGDLESLVYRYACRSFNLRTGPLLRAGIWTTTDNRRKLSLVTHHIAVDFWSLVVMLDDICEIYSAIGEHRTPQLPAFRHSVAEFAENEQKLLNSPESDALWQYWTEKLNGELPVLNLGADYARKSAQEFAGDTYEFAVPAALASQLREVARTAGLTPYALFASAFAALLHRYTGQRDILIASPMLARTSADWEPVVGYLTNPVVLRFKIDPAQAFTALMSQTSAVVLEALENQALPFPALAERLGGNDPSRPSLCQVGFSWDRPHHDRRNWTLKADEAEANANPTMFLTNVRPRQMGAPYELSIVVFEDGERLTCAAQFNTGIFRRESIERFAVHFQNMLTGVAAAPACTIMDLPIMSDGERIDLLGRLGRNDRAYPATKTVEKVFEEQAELHREALAVQYGESELTYRELNQRSNQVAHYLMAKGVNRDALVAICLPRSCELVVAMLGILKAGATYVPLDPDYPMSRLRFMLEDTGCVLVLTQASLRPLLPVSSSCVCLDQDEQEIGCQSTTNPGLHRASDATAYVMYTSGSTGTPKGICIPHRGITRLAVNTDYVSLRPGDRVLQASNACFDASTFEIWGALLNGATVAGISKEAMLNAPELAPVLRALRITTMFLTTALFHQLAREAPDVFGVVREVLFGGEMCDAKIVREVLKQAPATRIVHVYGPTETTTFATWHEVKDQKEEGPIPIGLPIANTEVYVLNEQMRLLPIGVPGELYIGGDGVATGYWTRENLTRERFVPHPFARTRGSILYRTGDLVRRRSDGALEFLGRNDDQVKVHGFRIEPGEVEAALRIHPEVHDAIVLAREFGSGEKKLAAYVVPRNGSQVSPQTLKAHLQSRLAFYMVPSVIVVLEQFQLTANGKIDRNALPTPEIANHAGTDHAEPRNAAERILAGIWEECLSVPSVGIHDNFFELGGDSISVVRVAARAKAAGIDITPLQVFKFQTIAELAPVAGMRAPSTIPMSTTHRDFGFSPGELEAITEGIRNIDSRE